MTSTYYLADLTNSSVELEISQFLTVVALDLTPFLSLRNISSFKVT